ncbi:polysialyltransferase family glycosyltransferase [Vibrio astriarenae]
MNIALLESHFQIVNYINKFNKSDVGGLVFIRLNGNDKNDSLIKNEDIPSGVNVKYFKIKPGDRIEIFKMTFSIMCTILKNGFLADRNIYIGDWRSSWMRMVAYTLSPFSVNVLDDGFASVISIEKVDDHINRCLNKYPFRILMRLVLKLSPTFHSSFNIPTRNVQVIPVSRNGALDSIIKATKPIVNKAVFIGCPLSDKNIMTRKDLLKHIELAFEVLRNKVGSIIYVPHRSESLEWLSYLEESFGKIKIVNPDVCIEEYLSQSNSVPKVIASFYSTALFNLSCNHNEVEVISFRLDYSKVNSNIEGIDRVYSYMESSIGIDVYEISHSKNNCH